MTFEFELPDPGEGLTEAELVEWFVEEGDEVEEDDALGEVETDKAVTEIPTPVSGTIQELAADEGDVVDVGEVTVVFETGEEEEKEGEEEVETGEERVFAAPRTRRYAREEDIDLTDIDGSGPNGRVLREDIDEYMQEGEEKEAEETTKTGVIEHPTVEIEPTSIDEDESRSTRRDLSGLRARIAENMAHSKTVIPHLTSGFEADAEELVALKERLDEKHETHITYTPIFVKAVVPALKEFPLVNASLDDTTDEIVEKGYYNIGFATHTEDGLLVPVIDDVDSKSIVEVANELNDLAEQARERSIDVADLQGGTFTVTNLALHGEHRTFGTPVINHPEAAIMGVGRIREKPVAHDGGVALRNRITLSLSYDHRLIDGVAANEFMEYVIEGIEDTDILLSRL